jgi:hypothetical protein
MALEELHGALVTLGVFARVEGTEVPALTGLWIQLSRIQAILA